MWTVIRYCLDYWLNLNTELLLGYKVLRHFPGLIQAGHFIFYENCLTIWLGVTALANIYLYLLYYSVLHCTFKRTNETQVSAPRFERAFICLWYQNPNYMAEIYFYCFNKIIVILYFDTANDNYSSLDNLR